MRLGFFISIAEIRDPAEVTKKAADAAFLEGILKTGLEVILKVVFISIIIASPIGWIVVRNLLKQFAYRIDISIMVFITIALVSVLIAMLTVSF